MRTYAAPEGFTWVDLRSADGDEVLEQALAGVGADATAGDLLARPHSLPTMREVGDACLFVLHGVTADEAGRIGTIELDCLLGDDWVVTYSPVDPPGLDYLWRSWTEGQGDDVPHDSADVVAGLYDVGVRRYVPVVQALTQAGDELALEAIQGGRHIIGDVQPLLVTEVRLRSALRAQRVVVEELLMRTQDEQRSLRLIAVRDLHTMLIEELALARTILTDALDAYRGAVADKTAEITRLLTIYAALVLPLSLVAGVWGMNVAGLPFESWDNGFVGVLAVMGVVAALSWLAFQRYGFVSVRLARTSLRTAGRLVGAALLPVERVILGRNLLGRDEE